MAVRAAAVCPGLHRRDWGIGILTRTYRLHNDLIRRIRDRRIDPGRVFDVTLPLEQEARV
jgi:hypothetical protein